MRKFASLATALIVLIMLFGLVPLLPPPASAAPEEGDNYWKDTFSDATGISASGNITVSGGGVTLSTATTTYFNNHTNNRAYEGISSSTDNEIDDPYSDLTSDDNVYQGYSPACVFFSYYAYTRFEFLINEAVGNITQIQITWKGYGDSSSFSSNGYILYIYNSTTASWEEKVSFHGDGNEHTEVITFTSGFSDYINSSHYLKFLARSYGMCLLAGWVTIATDYLDVTVSYYRPQGDMKSVAITPANLHAWDKFYGNHSIPSNTNISYQVLKASDDSVLCTITAAQAAAGYDISSCVGANTSIKLYAQLTTSTASTPTIYDWWVTWEATSAPTVDTLALYQSDESTLINPGGSMDPLVEFAVKVTVTDANKLDDITQVKLTIFYDSVGNDPSAPGTSNTQTCAIITWSSVSGWSIDPSVATTWVLVTGSCKTPVLSGTTGNWWFHFKPGKVATKSGAADNWDLYAKATDGASLTGDRYARDYEMNWYGEITVNTGSISWGTVSPGCSNNISPVVNITYICNGNYAEQIKTSQNWTSASGNVTLNTTGNPGAGEFSLKADDDDTIADAVQVLSASYTTFDTGTQTTEAGSAENNNHLWLSLGLGIPVDTYSGTIYFGIAP